VLVSTFLALFSMILVLQVFMRFVLRDPLAWPEELSRYLLIWTAFIGSSLAVREARFINIDIVAAISGPRLRRAFHFLMHLGFLLFCVIATYKSFDFITRIAVSGQVSPAMGLPMWMVYCAAPVGLTLAGLRTVQAMIFGSSGPEHHFEEYS
jgi:TRAP-type C4-dicarboxylate transport system permease small subunit